MIIILKIIFRIIKHLFSIKVLKNDVFECKLKCNVEIILMHKFLKSCYAMV